MIWIFKERGVPKGDALVTYEDTSCVQAAIKWFAGNKFVHFAIQMNYYCRLQFRQHISISRFVNRLHIYDALQTNREH